MTLPIDLRSAARQFARNRGLTVVALASLAVGIGVTVAITSVATAVLVRPLPYENPHELVMIWEADTGPSTLAGFRDPRRLARQTWTPAMALHWKAQPLPFVDFAVFESWESNTAPRVDLIEDAGVERLRGTIATTNVFSVLGVRAALGRTFNVDETEVVVISDRLWRRRFGADPRVLSRTLTLEGGRPRQRGTFTIIGVLPPSVRFDYPEETEIWLPLSWSSIAGEVQFAVFYRAVARLRPGTPIQAAEAALQVGLPAQQSTRFWLEPVHDYVVGRSRAALLLVAALSLLVLVSGAMNAATVFAASTMTRMGEIRIRRALGASQARLVRQVLTETAVLALLAGAVGVVAVSLALPGLRALLPAGLPGGDDIRLDWMRLGAVCGAVVLSTTVAGLFPAWLGVRDREQPRIEATHAATLTRAGLRLRMGLLGVHYLLVTSLLIVGGMLIHSFWQIAHVDTGFEARSDVYVAEINRIHPAYRNQGFAAERELLRRVRELSYVEAASTTSAIPLRGLDYVRTLLRPDGQRVPANHRMVEQTYFDVLRIPLLTGRWLTDADAAGDTVALVSQSFAAAMYPTRIPSASRSPTVPASASLGWSQTSAHGRCWSARCPPTTCCAHSRHRT